MIFCITEKYYNSLWYLMEQNLITVVVKKPTKKGDSYYFNIPIDFIRTGKINPEKKYEVRVFNISSENQR